MPKAPKGIPREHPNAASSHMGDRCVAATSLRCCGGTPGDQDGRGTNELSKIESILGTRMSQNLSRDRRLACIRQMDMDEIASRAELVFEGRVIARRVVHVPNSRCPPWRAKRRRVVPGSREATRDTRRAEGAKGDPKGASERGVQSYGRPVCSRNELAMLWRNAG